MIKTSVTGAADIKQEITKLMKRLEAPVVTVGIHEDAGTVPESGLTMATLGAIQNFGTKNIPARPWLQPGFEQGIPDYVQLLEDAIIEAVDGKGLEKALHQVGLMAVGNVQQYITALKTPKNDPATIRKKRSSNPLIDSGAMRAAVNYKLMSGKPEEGL